MGSPLTKKCRGLYTATNRYDVPEGALVTATNILISKDGVVQPRWGLVPSATTAALGNVSHWHRSIEYGGNIWFAGRDTVANTCKIAYGSAATFAGTTLVLTEDGPDLYSAFTGTATPYFDTDFIKAGQNLYCNVFGGLKRIESTTATSLVSNSQCHVSCIPRPLSAGLARTGSTTVTATTPLDHGYVVGLKVTLTSAGDANFGAGEFTIVTVPSTTTFTYVDATSSGTTTLAAQTFVASNLVGSSGFMSVNDRVAYRAHIISYDSKGVAHIGEVSNRTVVTNAAPFIGTAAAKNVQLAVLFKVSSPSANCKLILSRSRTAPSVEPNDVMGQVFAKYLTEAERLRGYVWITDINPDSTIQEALYTNEDQEGLGQNNLAPGACKTLGVWGKRLVRGNVYDLPAIEMQLLSTDSASGGLATGDFIVFNTATLGGTACTMQALTSGSPFTSGSRFSVFTGGTSSIDVKHTVMSLIDSFNWIGGNGVSPTTVNPLTYARATYLSTGADWPGRFAVQMTIPSQYATGSVPTLSAVVTTQVALAHTNRGSFAPKLGAQAITSGTITRASNVLSFSTAFAHLIEVGELITLYTSFTTQTVGTIAGTALTGVVTAVTGTTITMSNTGTDGTSVTVMVVAPNYMPLIMAKEYRNRVHVSKVNQIEAFPALNYVDVGDPGSKVLKTVQCKDSLLVFKEDGLFRVTSSGVFGEKLYAEMLDPNAILWAKDSAVAIQGKVMAWLTKGVAIINEQGVEKYVSERIQDRLRPTTTPTTEPDILSYPFSRRAQAFVDEVNGLYELRVCMTASPAVPYASTVNVIYDMLNDTWVEDDLAVVSEAFYQNKRYIIQSTSFYVQNDQVYAGTPTGAVTNGSFTATSTSDVYGFTYTGALTVGCTIYGSGLLSTPIYVLSASGGAGTAYSPTYGAALLNVETNWNSYSPVISTIQWAPITAGEENTLKRFAESQIMLGVRVNLVAEVSYSTELVTTAETLTCKLGAPVLFGGAGVGGYAPFNLRTLVPQQHRLGQQLNVKLVVRTAYGPWTVLGLGVTMKPVSTRVNR